MSNPDILTFYVPGDSSAVALGADKAARAIDMISMQLKLPVRVVRTGSRGAYFLEPLVEFDDPASGNRYGFANVDGSDAVRRLLGQVKSAQLTTDGATNWQGFIETHPFFARQTRLTFATCGVLDPLDFDQYLKSGGMRGTTRALEVGTAATLDELETSGLRGRGGAGFPAHIKWRTVAEQQDEQKYIACNADEGDSGTFADRMLMEGAPFTLLEGMLIAGLSVGADTGLIYVRSEYPAAIRMLKSAIAAMENANWLGANIQGSGKSFSIEVRRGAGSYVCGEESAMLDSLEGKRGQVRAKPPIPANAGFKGKPTLVHNVLSLAAVPFILAQGGAAYARHGIGRSTGTLPLQLSGMVKQPGLIEVDFGLALRELVEEFGGGLRDGSTFQAAQIGGPLGAYIGPDQFDVKLSYEDLSAAGGLLGHGGVVVFDQNTDLKKMAKFAFDFCAAESCGKCTPCRIGSVRGQEVMGRIVDGRSREGDLELIEDLCDLMEAGSLCAMGGLTPLPVRSALNLSGILVGNQKEFEAT